MNAKLVDCNIVEQYSIGLVLDKHLRIKFSEITQRFGVILISFSSEEIKTLIYTNPEHFNYHCLFNHMELFDTFMIHINFFA